MKKEELEERFKSIQDSILGILGRLNDLEMKLNKTPVLEPKDIVDSGYNPKMVFSMPRQSRSDKRKIIAILDLPNIINTCLNEKLENGDKNPTFFDPKYVKVLLDKYVYIYGDNIDRIWIYSTPDYDQVNEYLIGLNNRTEVVLYKDYDSANQKWKDTDNPIKMHLRDLYDDLEEEDSRISRILLFTGDGDYYNEVGDFAEQKRIPFYIIGHLKGFSPLWKQLISVNHKEDLRKLRELVFTYRYYKNKTVEDEMK